MRFRLQGAKYVDLSSASDSIPALRICALHGIQIATPRGAGSLKVLAVLAQSAGLSHKAERHRRALRVPLLAHEPLRMLALSTTAGRDVSTIESPTTFPSIF